MAKPVIDSHLKNNMPMNSTFEKISALRRKMEEAHIDAYIIENSDPHQTEYLPDHWQIIRWLCGFKGEVATLIITTAEALLWTDSRFFISGAAQLEGTSIALMKMKVQGVPTIDEWLSTYLRSNPGATVAGDRRVLFGAASKYIQKDIDLISSLWDNRPSLPLHPIELYPESLAGENTANRLQRIRKECLNKETDALFVSALDEIVWALNLRGSDILCTPVFVAYLLITQQGGRLFVDHRKVTQEVSDYLERHNIEIRPYEEGGIIATLGIKEYLAKTSQNIDITLVEDNPIQLLKSIKNETEMEGFRSAMHKDGIALTQFYHWLEGEIKRRTVTEMDCVRKLTYFHSLQPLYKDESFPAIIGWNEHAAMPHYEPGDDHDTPISGDGLLLIDAGSQYLDGTTDMTRTIGIGNVSAPMKRDYTLVLKGHIRLATAVFPVGTRGDQLDALARLDLWKDAKTYRHGTGHGVGHYLGCHEGPMSIRMEHNPQPILPGMVISNEPAIYLGGQYGIRHENCIYARYLNPEIDAPNATPCDQVEQGDFICFETLTLCYFDTTCLDYSLLNDEEVQWINNYNQWVYNELKDELNQDIRQWLAQKCKSI